MYEARVTFKDTHLNSLTTQTISNDFKPRWYKLGDEYNIIIISLFLFIYISITKW